MRQERRHRNGVRHGPHLKRRAQELRRAGLTHREIVQRLGIGLGSAYLWTLGIALTSEQRSAIQVRRYKTTTTFTKERRDKLSRLAAVRLAPYQYRRQHTHQGLIDAIVKFYRACGRIPLNREFGSRRIYREYFGSWNNAIQLAGFKPNTTLFAARHIAVDGHSCDSYAERIIDDWLYGHHILHERGFGYRGTNMSADFYIPPTTIIEFFGLAGVKQTYDQRIVEKRKLSASLNLQLVEIYPEDIFPTNRLGQLLIPIFGIQR